MTGNNWNSSVSLFTTPPQSDGSVLEEFTLTESDFATKTSRRGADDYVIVGFDTEFQTPDAIPQGLLDGVLGKYTVLSYQFHCIHSNGTEWNGICCPPKGERMSLNDFCVFALASGKTAGIQGNLPRKLLIVGHFTRADLPAFSDFKTLQSYVSNVRSTFISIDGGRKVLIHFPDATHVTLQIVFRDTMLLTPQTSRKLEGVGELVGLPKLRLGGSDESHRGLIKQMSSVINTQWESFRQYAIQDAHICAIYMKRISDLYLQITGERKFPVTLSSIGVSLLKETWDRISPEAIDKYLGTKVYTEKTFIKELGYFKTEKRRKPIEPVYYETAFTTECYHGGRNEQFWFGPCFEDEWNDFDLSSAYPTAMSLIGAPDWHGMFQSTDLDQFTADTLGFAWIEFEFPETTRYPTIPVRTSNGLVFPLKGLSECAAPEIFLARSLGAKITIKRGLIVPSDRSNRIFGTFIRDCITKRKEVGSKTLEGLFWKEISNSTYGKTAQGLQKKRVYDMHKKQSEDLPVCEITNAYFAAFITSFVRATLGEIINALPENRCVFSCTTDGFLTNATKDDVDNASTGTITRIFRDARLLLTGTPDVLEIKHQIKKPLGWRTRGQATLIPGNPKEGDGDFSIVLAKGGINTPERHDTDALQNEFIVSLFFDRTPESELNSFPLTGVRDIIELDTDLVSKIVTKRLSMEFDWKRQPKGVGFSKQHQHLVFSTRPWESIEQFEEIRSLWEGYNKDRKHCLKTVEDYQHFSKYCLIANYKKSETGKYLKKTDGDLKRLRQLLAAAFKQHLCGMSTLKGGMTATNFSDFLNSKGVPSKRSDIENSKNRKFIPHSCPPTDAVIKALQAIKESIPQLDVEMFLAETYVSDGIVLEQRTDCHFVQRCV